jgi:hypothetical protein
MKIETSAFGSLIVITFKNTSIRNGESMERGVIDSIICPTREIAHREIARLEKLPHIEIINTTDAVVVAS